MLLSFFDENIFSHMLEAENDIPARYCTTNPSELTFPLAYERECRFLIKLFEKVKRTI